MTTTYHKQDPRELTKGTMFEAAVLGACGRIQTDACVTETHEPVGTLTVEPTSTELRVLSIDGKLYLQLGPDAHRSTWNTLTNRSMIEQIITALEVKGGRFEPRK